MGSIVVSGGQPARVLYSDSPQRDAFGRLRVSNPETIFDSKLLADKQSLFWDEAITDISGSATSTHSTALAAVTMHVEAGDTIIRQTFMRFNYQPGKSQTVDMTYVMGAGVVGVTKRLGLFDANNGLFLEQSGTTLRVVIRNGGSDTVVNQSDWNIDPLDGGGPSGITLDVTLAQLFIVDFQWLSVGRVRFNFAIGGENIVVHEHLVANVGTGAYMATPNLPLRFEIVSTTGISDLVQICSSVISEGGQQASGVLRTVSTNGFHVDANVADTIYALVGIRLKTTHLFAAVQPLAVTLLAETNDDFEWMMLLDPTVAGTFTYSDETNSAVQAARGALANTVTGGTFLLGGFALADTQVSEPARSRLRLGSTIDGTRQEIVLCARPLSNNLDIQGSLTFEDLQ